MSVGCIIEGHKPRTAKPPKGARGPDLRLTTSGRLMDAILRHRHALLRAENGAAARLVAPLKQAHREIIGELQMLAARDGATGSFSNLRRERLIVMEARIRQSLNFAETEALGAFTKDLKSLQAREAEIQIALLNREIPTGITLDLVTPPPFQLDRILMQPLGGTRWSTRLVESYGGLVGQMSDSLAASVTLGEGMREAARRLNKVTGIGIQKSVLLARTEIQRVASETAYETYVANSDVVKGVVIVATLDDRTCFPAGTMVATPCGERRIEDIQPGDIVVGGSGRACRVAATRRKRWDGPMTGVTAQGRLLWSTPDHRVLTPDGWVESAALQVEGEVVALKDCPQTIHKRTFDDFGFRNPDYPNAFRGDLGVPSGIPRLVAMPIVGVSLEGNPVGRQEEVNRPSADLVLLNKLDTARFQRCAKEGLKAGLSSEAPIATNRAESRASPGWYDPKVGAAMLARQDQRRSTAVLATVCDIRASGVESLPAPRARFVHSDTPALARAVRVPIGIGSRHRELLTAGGAGLGHSAPAARVGAVDLATTPSGSDREHLTACGARLTDPLASTRRVVAVVGTEPGTASRSSDVATLLASQLVHAVKITGKHRVDDVSLDVYDIQVEGDESFVAEGVVVHNCIICGGLDGRFFPLGAQVNLPPFHPACRCFPSPVVRSLEELGLPPADFPPSTRASMDGQVPKSVDYESWFGTQTPEFQRRVLGPTRFRLYNEGRVTIDSMAKDLRILPIDELPAFSLN